MQNMQNNMQTPKINMQNMQNNMQTPKSICRIVHCPYSAYLTYICTPHFADVVTVGAVSTVVTVGAASSPAELARSETPSCSQDSPPLRGRSRDIHTESIIPSPTVPN